ncbi:hypothetical protein VTH06DRAFT_4371 [Thermothelomyces fergusii]
MDHRPQAWGRPRDDVYGPYDASYLRTTGPKTATQSPAVTGTSVIAIKFKDGVVMAADNLASYGSLARFTDVKRLRPFLSTSVVGFGGDVSDMQFLDRHLNELAIDESYEQEAAGAAAAAAATDDSGDNNGGGGRLNAANLHKYLSKLMYRRRNAFDPLWNQILPIMRRYAATEEDAARLSRDEAVAVVRECMKVLFYRDARSLDRYSIAVVTRDGVELSENEQLERQSWAFAERIRGYGTQTV